MTEEEESICEDVLLVARGCGRDWQKVMDISPLTGKEYYENRKSIGMVKVYVAVYHCSRTCICDHSNFIIRSPEIRKC